MESIDATREEAGDNVRVPLFMGAFAFLVRSLFKRERERRGGRGREGGLLNIEIARLFLEAGNKPFR